MACLMVHSFVSFSASTLLVAKKIYCRQRREFSKEIAPALLAIFNRQLNTENRTYLTVSLTVRLGSFSDSESE